MEEIDFKLPCLVIVRSSRIPRGGPSLTPDKEATLLALTPYLTEYKAPSLLGTLDYGDYLGSADISYLSLKKKSSQTVGSEISDLGAQNEGS